MKIHILYVLKSEEVINSYYKSEDGFKYLESQSRSNEDVKRIEFFSANDRFNYILREKKYQYGPVEYTFVTRDEVYIQEDEKREPFEKMKDFAREWTDSFYGDYDEYIKQLQKYAAGIPSDHEKIVVESAFGTNIENVVNAMITMESKRVASAIENFYKSLYL